MSVAIEAYLKKHQNRFIMEGKQGTPEDGTSSLEDYRKALTESKEQQAAPAMTVIDKDMSTKADYIEFLYSDKEEHKKDMVILWEQQHKRLSK